jgi:hypothetical protein
MTTTTTVQIFIATCDNETQAAQSLTDFQTMARTAAPADKEGSQS